jgi:beta-glucanase (GH16 family)
MDVRSFKLVALNAAVLATIGVAGHDRRAGAAGVSSPTSAASGTTAPAGWTLTWSDEFNGAAGAIDRSKWAFDSGGGGFGNDELEYYTDRTSNVALDGGGNLVITARAEPYGGRSYTSGRIKTAGHFTQAYGRIEARLQIPRGQGIWPAFWMLGQNIDSVGWPRCGEIDIMENIGREPNSNHGSLHGPGYSGAKPLSGVFHASAPLADGFHTYAVEWEPNAIRFYVDQTLYETRTPRDVPAGSRWVYDHPFFIILNVAVGGHWPGSPDGSTQFPQALKVDYVRVFKKR